MRRKTPREDFRACQAMTEKGFMSSTLQQRDPLVIGPTVPRVDAKDSENP